MLPSYLMKHLLKLAWQGAGLKRFASIRNLATMVDSPKITWRGREHSRLSDDELEEASDFCLRVYSETINWAPMQVWVFFNTMLTDLTLEKAKRLERK